MLNGISRLKFVALFVIFISNAFAFSNEKIGEITGDVSINLHQEKIFAKLKYDYVAIAEPETEVKLYLNKNFNVTKVKCRNCQSFKFDREAQRLPTLTISLDKPLQTGKRLQIEIEYDGELKGMYHKEHNFLELGLDWLWYPVHKDLGQFNYLYRLQIKTDVPDYQIVGNGRTVRKGKNWQIESKVPDYDIALVLTDNLSFRNYNQNGYNLKVISKHLPDTILENIRETLDFYNSTFGANNQQREVTAVIRSFPEISGQGGYARKNYFILPKIENELGLFSSVAHELAHHWWIGANQQNAWLNESFAEYSSMLATRRFKGMVEFNKIVEQKQNLNENLPPIYGFDRTKNRQQTPRVLYVKGALKLYELEQVLGEEKFLRFLQKVADAKIRETDQLIELLAKFSSRGTADKFLTKLKE